MSAVDSTNLRDFLRIKEDDDSHRRSLSGLTLDAVLFNKRPEPPSRTLLDIIRDEDPRGGSYKGIKEKKTWKSFRDRLRLKRTGSAWTSSLSIPTSDIPIQNNNRPPQFSRRSSVRYETVSSASTQEMTRPYGTPAENTEAPAPAPSARPQISRRGSTRMVLFSPTQSDDSPVNSPAAESPVRNSRPQISRHNSTRFGSTTSDPTLIETSVAEDESEPPRGSSRRLSAALAEERAMSAREVVADQEAEEAAADEEEEEEEEEAETPEAAEVTAQPVRMSLMDLLEETDRQMGFVGSRYTMGDEDLDEEEDEEEEDEEEEAGSVEYNCCVCMVRHKGAAFIPCGHTFCRLCSRELWVQRGNCPLCNGFILEILDIF